LALTSLQPSAKQPWFLLRSERWIIFGSTFLKGGLYLAPLSAKQPWFLKGGLYLAPPFLKVDYIPKVLKSFNTGCGKY